MGNGGGAALLVGAALALAAVSAEAQARPGSPGRGEGPGRMMMADLGRVLDVTLENGGALELSDTQRTGLLELQVDVERVLAPFREELDALREGGPRGRDRERTRALLGRVQEATAPHRIRFEEIMTSAQQEALLPLLRRRPG